MKIENAIIATIEAKERASILDIRIIRIFFRIISSPLEKYVAEEIIKYILRHLSVLFPIQLLGCTPYFTEGRSPDTIFESAGPDGTLVAFAFDYDDYENNGFYGYMVMTSIVCESEDEARKLYESLISGVANKDDPKIISEDEYEPFVVVYEERPEVPDICHWGIYKQGNTVLYLDGLTDEKDTKAHQMFKDICKKLNIKDPAEAVKESDK